MSSVAALPVLIVALVISAQMVMFMERGRSMRKRLQDLGWGGDAWAVLFVAALVYGGVGALIGSLAGHPTPGAALGLTCALLCWTGAVVWAHRGS